MSAFLVNKHAFVRKIDTIPSMSIKSSEETISLFCVSVFGSLSYLKSLLLHKGVVEDQNTCVPLSQIYMEHETAVEQKSYQELTPQGLDLLLVFRFVAMGFRNFPPQLILLSIQHQMVDWWKPGPKKFVFCKSPWVFWLCPLRLW